MVWPLHSMSAIDPMRTLTVVLSPQPPVMTLSTRNGQSLRLGDCEQYSYLRCRAGEPNQDSRIGCCCRHYESNETAQKCGHNGLRQFPVMRTARSALPPYADVVMRAGRSGRLKQATATGRTSGPKMDCKATWSG